MNRKIVFIGVAFSLALCALCGWTAGWAGEGTDQGAAPASSAGAQAPPGTASRVLSDTDRQTAVSAAETWLKLIDEMKYEESYKTAAGFFRNSVSYEEWFRAIATFRGPHGKTVSRNKISTSTSPDEPALPEGEYVVVEYHSNFEKKKDCKETVTCMKEPDGKWRVVGYHLVQSAPEAEAKQPETAP